MEVARAQREVREVFLDGFPGQIVAGALWLAAAAAATWGSRRAAILILVVGGALIFPITLLVLRAMGSRARLSAGNPMAQLAQQIAFTVPLSIPLAGGAALCRPHWFFPACALIVGVHYLPFVHLYGMRAYAALAAILIFASLSMALYGPAEFSPAGWLTGAVLVAFGAIGLAARAGAAERPSSAG